jgi:hypothetical protein
MRLILASVIALIISLGALQAKPDKKDPPNEHPAPKFKPIEINNELDANDPKDEKLNFPSRKYTIKLHKDKTYVIDLISKDYDAYLRLLDKKGKQLAEDDDSGGELNSRIIHSATESGDHQVVVTTFDGQVGKFTLKIRELNIKGEAKARTLGKGGLTIDGELGQNDSTDLDKLSKVHSVQLKAGQSYVVDVKSEDFDCQVYVFDGKGKLLGQDNDKVVCTASADGPHHLIVKSFDDQAGKFDLKVREFILKGEAKTRDIGKDGLKIAGNIGEKDKSAIGKLGKVYSVNLKAGQEYTIDLDGGDLDMFLYLFDSKTALVAKDDDSVAPKSHIVFRAERDGVYHIIATTVTGTETGDFTLKVSKGE